MVVKHMLKLGVDTRENIYKELVLMVHGTNVIDMMEEINFLVVKRGTYYAQ